MKKTIYASLALATTVLLLDYLFHRYFTQPQETIVYFAVKFLIVFIIGLFVFHKLRIYKVFVGIIVFDLIFGIYYRLVEFYQSSYFGARVPDIILGNTVIVWNTMPIISSFAWALFHGLFFFLPALIILFLIKFKYN